MKLIDFLVRELPGMGGWRDGFLYASQDRCGRVFLYEQKPYISDGFYYWEEAGYTSFYHASRAELSDDWNTAVITREQYEAALAVASKPVWNGEGIPPVGCECLVSSEDGDDLKWQKIKVVHVHNGEVIGVIDMPSESNHDDIGKYSKEYNDAIFLPFSTYVERKLEDAVNEICGLFNIEGKFVRRVVIDGIYYAIAEGKIPGIRLDDETGR